MTYKIKIKRTGMQDLSYVGYVERLRWKKKANAERYKDEYVKKNGRVVKI